MDLVGRERELERLVGQLRVRRLVTVIGPGGIGKTALAHAALARLAPSFPLGAIKIDLTRIDRGEAVPETVASQLGFSDFRSVVSAPGDRPALLLFDNCEHVLAAAAAAVHELLGACAMSVVLATSRSPLDLPGEAVLSLGPLAPPSELASDPARADALALLALRARDNGVALDGEDLLRAAELCRLLDGVPLALEIAAARLRSRSVAELLEEIRERPHELARPRFRGKPAHRSVAEMVGWSHALLSPRDRAAFARLAVFAGPFTAEMARAVALPDGSSLVDARERLESLADASLVVADSSGEVTWYRMLHPVRAIALAYLGREGDPDATHSRVVDHAVAVALDVIRETSAGWEGDLIERLLALYPHLAGALRWSIEHDERPDRALALLSVLWGVIHQAHTAEVRELGEQVLERWDEPAAPLWPHACATVATCRYLLGERASAIELAERALPYAQRSRFAPATLRRVLGHTYRAMGDLERAARCLRDAAASAREHQSFGLALELEIDGGLVAAELGDLEAGLAAIEAAQDEAVQRGASLNAAWAHAVRGAALARAERSEGIAVLEDALEESRALGYPAGESFSLRALAVAHLARGDEQPAARALLALLEAMVRRGGMNDLPMVLDTAAELLERVRHPAWADLGATARVAPITTLGSRNRARVCEAAVAAGGAVLAPREAFLTCRSALTSVLEPEEASEGRRTGAARPEAPPAALVAEGDVWRIDYRGESVRVRDSKGMGDLATLLAEPGRSFSCLDLMGAVVRSGDHGEVLDAAARRAYEQRVLDLQHELEDAESMNDPGRAERARVELDALVDELTRASGLGGRARRGGDDGERARSAVTQRLRGLVKRLEGLHPALGAHLRASIGTGSFCIYRPEDGTTWSVRRGA